ncbi:hypothetical protein GCM10010252_49060 [Streptomyces aureoverticillatus]|nr:hypothetical protein GCM10010252_49060 [Streptomyces aureoverticillatus]
MKPKPKSAAPASPELSRFVKQKTMDRDSTENRRAMRKTRDAVREWHDEVNKSDTSTTDHPDGHSIPAATGSDHPVTKMAAEIRNMTPGVPHPFDGWGTPVFCGRTNEFR